MSPLSVKATTLGVRRLPSWLGITLTSPPSMTATTEFVVPKSIPIIVSPSATVALLSERLPAIGFLLSACPGRTREDASELR
jgi:hypothetical protein